jgi:hypothetical protein
MKNIDVGDLMLMRNPRTKAAGKLELKWTGLFIVTEKTRPGSFRLADSEGKELEHQTTFVVFSFKQLCNSGAL